MATSPPCVFCNPREELIFHRSPLVIGMWDAFPVSKGHALLLTRDHVGSWFDATEAQQQALTSAIQVARDAIMRRFGPIEAFNLGVNVGAAAGQTISHVHLHVIPRRDGDVPDPRGGVRHVIPATANYLLERARPLATGGEADPFSRHVFPLFDRATDIAIVAAFIQESGLRRLTPAIRSALSRGGRIRIVTGDYLDITQASALEALLDWQRANGAIDDSGAVRGTLHTRVVKMAELPDRTSSFHPKSWRFEAPSFGAAFVGSSNMSRSALDTGVEWNLRVDRERDPDAYGRIGVAFEDLWTRAHDLDEKWIEEYAQRARLTPAGPPIEFDRDPLEPVPTPHAAQVAALENLRAARDEGRRRALVLFATGLGKTWLAAFDYQQLEEELGRPPRLLFVAHRREILIQASLAYRRLLRARARTPRVSWFVEDHSDISGDLVFASVLKIARKENLERLRAERFDYVVIDEVHHAAADSYRRLLGAIDPRFLLGLTATPDRADAADILGLFDDFVAHRADVAEGIALKRLAPFHYFGVKDDIDYAQIPWRNRRFGPQELALAAQTEARMQSLWRAWQEHPATRSLVFCCSVPHAKFVREWLAAQKVRVKAVFAAEGSDDRDASLRALDAGEIDAVCAVDIFNEGVDVPSIDRVVMLRPTESGVVFLQQLGRGLRANAGKAAVTIIDFVGNHRVFLEHVRALLSLAGSEKSTTVRDLLASAHPLELPAGCSVDIELEAKELLSRLFNVGGANGVERAYRDLRTERGVRPSAGELYRMRYLPSVLRERYGSWFGFVRSEGDLTDVQLRCLEQGEPLLREIEVTQMTRSFKMVTLEALLEEDQLFTGMQLDELAQRCHAILERSPGLKTDVVDEPSFESANGARWRAYWSRNPVQAWLSEHESGRGWFRLEGDRFRMAMSMPPAEGAALHELVRELVDYRLAQYRARQTRRRAGPEGFVCRVTWNRRDPILKLPSQAPQGETDARLPDGRVWQFRLMAQFCNVARPVGSQRNQLPDLLRGWFGPIAGHPGTGHEVRFRASPDGLVVEPVASVVVDLASRRGVIAYPDLRAAAGHALESSESPQAERVVLPVASNDRELLAVRVSGDSMNGGKEPLRDGDWAVMRLSRSAASGAVENRVVLMQIDGDRYQIKRLKRDGETWSLKSDNPTGPQLPVRADSDVVIARLEKVVRPEDLAPAVGTEIDVGELPARFGLEELAPKSGRYGGHLFIFIDRKKVLIETDRVEFATTPRRPGETAFVCAKQRSGVWRYFGVGRQLDDATTWAIPGVDFSTWKQWGQGRDVSRRLPDHAEAAAEKIAAALVALPQRDRWIEQPDGRRAWVLGRARQGGVRINGGRGGFAERTVSLVDIAWVLVARDDAHVRGGIADEERVNRLRYLEGTPKASTRWVDTGWGIACVLRGAVSLDRDR